MSSTAVWLARVSIGIGVGLVTNCRGFKYGRCQHKLYKPTQVSKPDVLVLKADELLSRDNFDEAYQLLLPHKDSNEIELLWRLAETMYHVSEQPHTSKALRKQLTKDSYKLTSRALSLNGDHPETNRTMAMVSDIYFREEGYRSRIAHCVEMKDYLLKANKLDPNDPVTLYMIGHWYRVFARLPWIQKKLAKLYHGDMQGTYEDALMYFEKSLEKEHCNNHKTKFYVMNFVLIGECHQHLGDNHLAIKFYQQALRLPERQLKDKEAHSKAAESLKELGQDISEDH